MAKVSTTPAPTPAKLALTMRESGQLASCCERVIWQAIKDGDLKAVRLGRSVRIMHVELVRFLESRQG